MRFASLRRVGRASVRFAGLLTLVLSGVAAQAQRSAIIGTLLDAETGETLIGANVALTGTTTGAVTDLDGAYRIVLAPGTYSLTFSYIGYDAQTVEGIVVASGATVRVDRQLTLSSAGLGEVVVQAEGIVDNTDVSLLAAQARAPVILDGISAQQIRRSPDANSGEALRRVTGVTVTGGRFVTVRGVPERYNGTLLNGTPVPSTESDRRAFAYDLIPSNLLANVLVAKSATPDLPGDFAGGVLQLNTIDFPEAFSVTASISAGVNNATGEAILAGDPSELPAGLPANLGLPTITNEQRAQYGRELGEGFQLRNETGHVVPNGSLTIGGSQQTALGRVGAVGAVTFRSGYSLNDASRREFEASGESRFDLAGLQTGYAETAGGLLNLAWRPAALHSFSFKNFYSQTSESDVAQLDGIRASDLGANVRQTAVRHSDRTLYAGQLAGEHFLSGLGRTQVDWTLYRATTTRDEPDYRRLTYFQPLDDLEQPYRLLIGSTVSINNGGRFYSDLDEVSTGGRFDITVPVAGLRIKTGGFAELRDRDFSSRLLAVTTPNQGFDFALLELPMDSVFNAENFGLLDKPGCENGGFGCQGFLLNELQNGGGSYTASQDVTSGYAMIDTPLSPISRRLRFVGGLRVEHSVQRLQSTTANRDSVDTRSPYTSLLPSVNLTYNLGQQTNLRFAYSRNLNRPELRELAPFQFYDFETQTTVYGNDSLRQASIQNFDLRLETFPSAGQILSASFFYKYFDSPIEKAIVPGVALNAERSFTNADYAINYGAELEARMSLGRIASWLEQSSAVVNYTRVFSNVVTPATAITAERSGRPLQGQAPYVINLGLTLVAPRVGTQFSVLYNRLGSRIVEVSSLLDEDIVEDPRDLLDLALSQPFMGRYEARVAVRDLFQQNQNFSQGADIVRADVRGRSITFGLSARL